MFLWVWIAAIITIMQVHQPAWAYDHTSVQDAVRGGCNQPGEIAAKDVRTVKRSKYHDDVFATCMLSLTNNIVSRTLPPGTMVNCGKPPHCHTKNWENYTWGIEPTLVISSPGNGASYQSPANLLLIASTTAVGAVVNSISFHSQNTQTNNCTAGINGSVCRLGIALFPIGSCAAGITYCGSVWRNVTGGTYTIKAQMSIGSTFPGIIYSNTVTITVKSTKTYRPTASWNGQPCYGILLFGGSRTGGQTRVNGTDTSNTANYLEGSNATLFPNGGAYTGTGSTPGFSYTTPGADMVRCISTAPTPIP